MKRVATTAGERLARSLCTALEAFAGKVEAEVLAGQSWTSITFSGERHRLCLRLEDRGAAAAADDLLARLPDWEPNLPGHLLVDIGAVVDERSATGDRVRMEIEATTIEAD